jgi:sigma-B regulation protein RsbU (phosphoserine phosphatase)
VTATASAGAWLGSRVLVGLAGPGLVVAAGRWCQDVADGFGLGHADAYRLEVCVEELTTNLVKYGGPAAAERPLRLRVDVRPDGLDLVLVDAGVAFDPLSHRSTPAPHSLHDLRPGGQGVHLVQVLSDGGRYERRGDQNHLTLDFRLEQPASVPPRPAGLAGVGALAGVPESAVDEALGPLTVLDVVDDLVLLERGTVNDVVHALLDGAARVYLDRVGEGDEVPVEVGDCIGEMSVVDDLPVSAHVHVSAGSRLLAVDADTFLHRLLPLAGVARNLLSAQAERMRRADLLTVDRTRRLVEAEQAARELQYARDIQASLLPAEPLFADDPRLDCVGRMRPAREVGGDFYDVLMVDPTHLLVVVGDVCGKGLPAALFMVRAVAALRALPRAGVDDPDHLARLVGALNEQLCERNDARQYLTAFVAVVDLASRTLHYVNAGHNPPLLSVDGGAFELVQDPINPPVGLVAGLAYRGGRAGLGRDSRFLLYTDGVTEAEDPSGGMFGEDRLVALCRSARTSGAGDLVEVVLAEVEAFAAGARQSDDITVVGLDLPGSEAMDRED